MTKRQRKQEIKPADAVLLALLRALNGALEAMPETTIRDVRRAVNRLRKAARES